MFQMFDIPVRSQSRNRTTLPLDFRAKLDTCFSSDATHPILSWDLSPAADGGKSKEQTVFSNFQVRLAGEPLNRHLPLLVFVGYMHHGIGNRSDK